MAEQKKRTKKQSKRAQEIDHADRFRLLLEETQAFCRAVGLHENLIVEIAKADNDWGLERRACSTQRAKNASTMESRAINQRR